MKRLDQHWKRSGTLVLCLLTGLGIPGASVAATDPPKNGFDVLDRFSDSVQHLTGRVAPSVVQIIVDRYGRETSSDQRASEDSGAKKTIGSGVIVDPDGYIMTNAHVVEDARRIRVKWSPPAASEDDGEFVAASLEQPFKPAKDATLVGVFKEGDLALIKIAATGLPALPFADYKKLRQGQVVFAFGSREGLHNSVSMGVVSSVARQLDPDSPFVYVQTDAAINPGDSGGPLVNTDGEIVGLDTFILSQSGGSEGMGFAIPSPLVELVSTQLKRFGHFHRQLTGIGVQSITPTLASALHLGRDAGVLITDVLPGSPAESAGLRINDIVLAVDGKQARNLPLFMMTMLGQHGKPVSMKILRGDRMLPLEVTPVEAHKTDGLTELIKSGTSELTRLGVIGITVDKKNEDVFSDLRTTTGVYVVARSESSADAAAKFQAGDVIHEINGTAVRTVQELRRRTEELKRGAPVALLIERERKLQYVAFEME